jgi:hypothetical protein
MKGTDHRPIEIDGLWGIGFGNGAVAGPPTHGLFGSITAP